MSNVQNEWKEVVMSELKDPKLWASIKDKPIEEKVSLVLQTYSKMYQHPNHPYEIIASYISNIEANLSADQLKKLEKKTGQEFVASVICLVKEYVENTIINEIDTVRKNIK